MIKIKKEMKSAMQIVDLKSMIATSVIIVMMIMIEERKRDRKVKKKSIRETTTPLMIGTAIKRSTRKRRIERDPLTPKKDAQAGVPTQRKTRKRRETESPDTMTQVPAAKGRKEARAKKSANPLIREKLQ